MALRFAVWASLGCAGLALASLAAGLVMGTLFFDDPHASYPAFVAWFKGPAVTVVVATGTCLMAAWWLSHRGRRSAAIALAACPVFIILGGMVYLVS